ncbi:putative orotate phosphoribosyltransferase [Enterobacteria phage ECGD1] [Escherichia phage vB_Eco_PATM]|nr:putative orotate phosphoribosyltransferase [Enterobacteria phage ECGD1] [Escherichia phage vB_Eco_PATM]
MRNQIQHFANTFTNLKEAKFNIADYSKLKFGSNQAAKRMGRILAESFFSKYEERLVNESFVVIPSPYNYVKNAATVLSEHFVDHLNYLISIKGGKAVEWDIVHRKVSYINDYGFLSKEDRKALIDGDTFSINRDFWGNKTLVFIDDVNITGTHEEKLIEILDKEGVENDTFFLYFAKYEGTEANTEAALNFNYINNLAAFIKMIKQETDAKCLVRPIKYLMSQSEVDFKIALSQLPLYYVEQLFFGCLAEGYNNIEKYKENFDFLRQFFESNIINKSNVKGDYYV